MSSDKPWVTQPVPSNHFIAQGRGSFEMNYANLRDVGSDDPVPVSRFYIHNRTMPPNVDPATWTLTVDGDAVTTPLSLSYQDLLELPSMTIRAVLDCGANARAFFPPYPPVDAEQWPPIGFTQWTWGAMGAAEWTGVSLAEVLSRAGAETKNTWAHFTGLDPIMQGEGEVLPYQHVMPTAALLENDAMLAWNMNGHPLTRDHGFPVRAFFPGSGGNVAVKWLTSLAITRGKPPFAPLQENQLLIGPAYPQPVVPGEENPKSAFELPMDGTVILTPAKPHPTLYGRAWSAPATITYVSIAIEKLQPDGTWSHVLEPHWHRTKLLSTPQPRWWVRFSYEWCGAKPGVYRLYSCASDDQGSTQPPAQSVIWNQHGLHYNGVAAHPIRVMELDDMP